MLSDTLFSYLTQGNLWNYFLLALNTYFPYGLFFWFLGFALFIIFYLKVKNLAYSGLFVSLYFIVISSSGLVINAYSMFAMRYFGLILGFIIGYYLYRALKG